MARGLSDAVIEDEWQSLSRNWYDIYQWKQTTGEAYTEQVSEWIAQVFPEIELLTDGLRIRSFRVPDHRGQIKLGSDIKQITEKRLVRAMFNLSQLPCLGKVIDYEVPLKDTDASRHGDIDLLSVSSNSCFCVEAKKPKSSESLLKAVLQAYVYTSLVATTKQTFLSSFGLDECVRLTPAVLTFANATSGKHLNETSKFPKLLKLIGMLNSRLEANGIAPMRFFLIQNAGSELNNCLDTVNEKNGDVKVVFRSDFTLLLDEVKIYGIV